MRIAVGCLCLLVASCGRLGIDRLGPAGDAGDAGDAGAPAADSDAARPDAARDGGGPTPRDGGRVDAGARDAGNADPAGDDDAGADTPDGGGPGPGAYCDALPHLADAPVIDGVIEPGLTAVPVVPVGWRNTTTPLPAGHALRYVAAWRPDGIYFFLEVTDPDRNPATARASVWMGDGVEIYVDHDAVYETDPPSYDAVGTRQLFVAAPASDDAPGTRAEIRVPDVYSPWAAGWASVPTASGYAVEAFVDATVLELPSLALAAGDRVGLDLAHNVSFPPGESGPEGNRLSQYFLKIREPPDGSLYDYPFNNEHAFCSAVLLAP